MHGRCRNLFHWFRLPLSPVLAAENNKPVSQGHKQLLIDKLDLVHRRHAGQRRFAVGAKHHIVGQVNAQSYHILQYKSHINS